jgi:succinylglutamate desuccinylase
VEEKPIEELTPYRSTDMNMNRLPADLATTDKTNYEINRAKELLPILAEFDAGLDIHSTDVDSSPMLIANKFMPQELMEKFPVSTVLENIAEVMRDKPIITFYGNGEVPAAVIEAGSHQSNSSYENALVSTVGFMQYMGILEKQGNTPSPDRENIPKRDVYEVIDSIFWEVGDDNMMLVKPFRTFETIMQGQLLAEDPTTGKKYFSPCDGHAVFPFMTGKPNNMNEEGMFITLPVRRV